MVKLYAIPPAIEDSDKRSIVLEIEDFSDSIAWRAYRQGSDERHAGSAPLGRHEYSFATCDGFRILVDSRDRAVLYAESMADVGRVFQPHPYSPFQLTFYPDKVDEVYRVAAPLPMEMLEVQGMGKSPIDYNFVRWVRRIPPFSPKWRKLTGETNSKEH